MPVTGKPPTDVEVEWQFDAFDLRPVERWLAPANGLTTVGVATLHTAGMSITAFPRPARRLVDVYMDTEDWRIGRSGYVLRVRRRAEGTSDAEATLKDRAPATDGLRTRLEVTEPLPTGEIGALGAAGPVGRRLRALAGLRPLHPIVEIKTRRRPFDLRIGTDTVAELVLDETVIEIGAGRSPMRLRRVEVEVVAAWADALRPMVDQMRLECGLQPATLSKFEAGLLASGMRVPAPPDLGPTAIGPGPSIGDVAYAVMRRNLSAMLAHEAGTRLGEDPEELHDMRVATRRLRAALALFADILPVRAGHVREELGWLAEDLGSVRDLDVQLERMDGWRDELAADDSGAMEDLSAMLQRERAQARQTLLNALDSTRYDRLVTGFATLLRQGPSRRVPASRAPAVAMAPDLIRERHRAAVKTAKRARRSGAVDDLHRLRIRCKRLRYTLEFVSEVYDGQTAPLVKRVVEIQDALGLVQDARVAVDRLQALATADDSHLSPATIFVMGGVAERHRREAEQISHRLPSALKKLRGARWRKLAALLDRRRAEFGAMSGWVAPSRTTTRRAMPVSPVSVEPVPAPIAPAPFAAAPAEPVHRPVQTTPLGAPWNGDDAPDAGGA